MVRIPKLAIGVGKIAIIKVTVANNMATCHQTSTKNKKLHPKQ